MATHPPIQTVDGTDEEFFDKLVDDDFPNSELVPMLAVGDISDEANVLSTLRFDVDDSGEVKAEGLDVSVNGELLHDYAPEDSNSTLPSDSFGDDSEVFSKNGMSDIIFGSSVNPGSESSCPVVKEVQWSLFSTDAPKSVTDGFDSYSDFFNKLGDLSVGFPALVEEENFNNEVGIASQSENTRNAVFTNSLNYGQHHDFEGTITEIVGENENVQYSSSNQYWDNAYPGWKYDPNTEQWYQVGGLDETKNIHQNYDSKSTDAWKETIANSDVSYFEQTSPSVAETMVDSGATKKVSYTNHASQGSNNYSENMFFDPQYPGWYYDTVSQEWHALDTNTPSNQHTTQYGDHQIQNGFNNPSICSETQNVFNSSSIVYQNQNDFKSSSITYQAQNGFYSHSIPSHIHDHSTYSVGVNPNNNGLQDQGIHCQDANWSGLYGNFNKKSLNTFQPETVSNKYTVSGFSENEKVQDPYVSSVSVNHFGNNSQKQLQGGHLFSQDINAGRSSAGRPPHVLVTFGFGGKLIVMNDNSSSSNKLFGSQDSVGGSITVLNMVDIATEKTDTPSVGMGTCNYFHSLCQQSIPGPLVGGNAGSRELNKWIDEKILYSESHGMDYRKNELLRLLLSLLKIAYQHYGKLRSPFGTDATSRENESPELEVAKLFASAKRHGGQFNGYGAVAHCLQNFPSEGHIRATAAEVQNYLVSGRTKEALHCAQEGQLWGPALVLAAQLGDQHYVDTVRQMAFHQLAAGSPLRTLCLLIAGHQADVFKTDVIAKNDFSIASNLPRDSEQPGINVMLDDWEENLAVVTANRTKGDELVIINLGDALWRERSEIIAAHICYLIAESDFEQYSDRARLCLIGADHLKFPRTFASPEAIQRTELYEYSKVLGNSQFILLPFQPYKLIYAHMLAEVGKVSDALKYCQAVLKSMKTGRSPEVERSRQSVLSLEERLKTHQQGGFTANLAPAKLVGKLLNLFDSTAHRVVGGGLPPIPPASQASSQNNGHFPHKVSTSQSTMVMSSLMGSALVEHIGENPRHNRSISEPDFARTPIQAGSSNDVASCVQENKASGSGASSRFVGFGFGSQIFQKTMGLVLRRSDRQAKLGEKNKFYYNENLKRWVEEGAEAAAEETLLPPPPTASGFQNGMPDYSLKRALKNEGSPILQSPESPAELSSGIPPIPPTSNQFSARGHTGVRSRYVDTFNHGNDNNSSVTGKQLFQSPSPPPLKSSSKPNPKLFIPKPIPPTEDTPPPHNENPPSSSSSSSSLSVQRFPSMSNMVSRQQSLGGFHGHSRRTASWSGSFPEMTDDAASIPVSLPLGEALGMQDLHEVEL